MRNIVYFFCIVGLAISQSQMDPPPEEDQFSLNFDAPVFMCSDEKSRSFADTSDVEVHRYNETSSYMSGFIDLLVDIENCTNLEITVEKIQGAHSKIILTHDICSFCDELNSDSSYFKYLKYFKLPPCPISPAKYEIDNWAPDHDDLPTKRVNEARYIATLTFYANPSCDCKEKTFLGCMITEFVIEPVED